MKIRMRQIVSLCLSLALCLTLALTAYADSNNASAGIYVRLYGECAQSETDQHVLNTRTYVTRNPNSAILKTVVAYYVEGVTFLSEEVVSDPGAVSLTHASTIRVTISGTPDLATVDHYVMDPINTQEIIHSTFTSTSIVLDDGVNEN